MTTGLSLIYILVILLTLSVMLNAALMLRHRRISKSSDKNVHDVLEGMFGRRDPKEIMPHEARGILQRQKENQKK